MLSVCMQTPALTPFPDLTQPELAYPQYPHPDIDPKFVTRLDGVYLQNLDMPELIEKARLAVVSKASEVLKADPDSRIDYIVLDLPCTFFMLRSLRYVTQHTTVHRSNRHIIAAVESLAQHPCMSSAHDIMRAALHVEIAGLPFNACSQTRQFEQCAMFV